MLRKVMRPGYSNTRHHEGLDEEILIVFSTDIQSIPWDCPHPSEPRAQSSSHSQTRVPFVISRTRDRDERRGALPHPPPLPPPPSSESAGEVYAAGRDKTVCRFACQKGIRPIGSRLPMASTQQIFPVSPCTMSKICHCPPACPP